MQVNNFSTSDLVYLPKKLKQNYMRESYLSKYTSYDINCDEFVPLNETEKEKINLVSKVLSTISMIAGINRKVISALADELMTIKNLTLLKKALEANVSFKFGLGDSGAVYSVDCDEYDRPKKKSIVFLINQDDYSSIYSVGHELGHAFDFETKIDENGLTSNLEYELIKNPDGSYEKADFFMPNTVSYTTKCNGKIQSIIEIDDIEQNASFSKEFEDAFLKDYIHMLDMDMKQGISEGTTFNNLLSDWKKDSYFAYFLGADREKPEISKTYMLKKELFAQLAGYSAFGHTSKPEFDKKVLLYFPNTYKFVDELIKKTL